MKAGTGYQSCSQKALFFGLADRDRVDRLEIHWPSGIVEVQEDIPTNQILHVVEPETP